MTTAPQESPDSLPLCYRMLFERNPLPMCVCEADTLRVLAVNQAAAAHYGYSTGEFVGLTLLDLHDPQDHLPLQDQLRLPADDKPMHQLWRHRHRSGTAMEVETVTQHIETEGLRAHIVLMRDVTDQRRAEQAQRELSDRLTSTLESITDAFFTLDRNWCFSYVNARAEMLLHRTRQQLLGNNVWEQFPEAVGSIYQREYQRAMDEGRTVSFETFFEPWQVWHSVNAYPSEMGLTVYFHDLTEERLTERRLAEERDTLAAVVNATHDAVISVNLTGLAQTFNPGAELIFGRSSGNMLGQSIELLMPERFRAGHRQHLARFAQSDVATRMMGLGLVKGLRADGQELDLEGTIAKITVQRQSRLLVTFRDVTERVRTEAEFAQSRTQLSELTQRLMSQEKALVKRLAQALHDQVGQTMAAIRMAHETMVAVQAGKVSPELDRQQSQMGMLIGQAIRQVRQVLIDLRPPLLEEHGLASALDNELRNRSLVLPKLEFSIHITPEVTLMRWPAEVEYAAFMIAREAIENALRHSGSSTLAVALSGGPLVLALDVIDEGHGLPAGATQRNGHLGILGMHERAQAVGATVTVDSDASHGTQVSFRWQPAP